MNQELKITGISDWHNKSTVVALRLEFFRDGALQFKKNMPYSRKADALEIKREWEAGAKQWRIAEMMKARGII